MSRPLLLSYPASGIDGADFDGTNDYLNRGGGLTGAVASTIGTLVAWLYLRSAAGQPAVFWINNGYLIDIGVSREIQIQANNTSGVANLRVVTAVSKIPLNTWVCFMTSIDLTSTSKRWIYVNDTDVTGGATWFTYTNSTMNFANATSPNVQVGASIGAQKWDGGMAEVWFAPGQYLDFSVQANRRLFISGTGKPVPLGSSGILPTGTKPLSYNHFGNEPPSHFAFNTGTGGAYTVTGALTLMATSPSD